ncbi:MAG TPA: deoxyribonuclease IV [Nitrospinota bacterium]|nr:deoxyribonuclease IV [Nitrospinota bacterium]
MFGAHMSIAGGLEKALERGKKINCRTIQIFTKSSNQWKAKEITDEDLRRFQSFYAQFHISPVVAHDSYLINLASPDPVLHRKSIESFFNEMERCEKLKIPYLVFHPGAHVGSGEKAGLKKIAQSINILLKRGKGFKVSLLLETTAGQGTSLGYKFEHLAKIIKMVRQKKSIGVCVDTCHIFAAGYDITTKKGYKKTFETFNKLVGLDKLKVFHINDSKKELGSRVDRHEHIGKGFLGLKPFKFLVNDRRFANIPKILETPKGPDLKEDVKNFKVLKKLIKK